MICFVVPCYNEEDNIKKVVKKFLKFRKNKMDIIFVNDGSTDNTEQVIKKYKKIYSWIKLISFKKNKGIGYALKRGFGYALNNNYQFIGQIDCDLTHPLHLIFSMLENIKKYDIVIASRFVKKGGMKNVPKWRVLLTILGQNIFRFLLKLKTKDITSGYKLMRTDVLKNNCFNSDSFEIQLEQTLRFEKKGYRIKEIPFILTARKIGYSKFKMRFLINYFLLILKYYFHSLDIS